MGDHWNDHPITEQVIGVVVALGKLVGLWQPHESRHFSRRDQTRADAGPVHDHDRLTARPTRRCTQTARYAVKADFGSLHVVARALVDRAGLQCTQPLRFHHLASIDIGHH